MVAKERSGVSGGLNKMEIQGFNSSPTICLKGVWVKNIEKFTIKILKFAQNEQTPHFRNVKNIHIFCKSKWKNWNRPKIENRNGASEKTFSYTRLLRITSRTSVCQDIFSAATVETLGHLVQRGYHKNPVKEDYTAYPHFAAWGPILVLGLAETNQKPQVVLTKWRYEDSPLRRRNQPVLLSAIRERPFSLEKGNFPRCGNAGSSSQVHGNLDEGRRSSEYRAVLPRCGRQKPLRQRRKTPKSPQMLKFKLELKLEVKLKLTFNLELEVEVKLKLKFKLELTHHRGFWMRNDFLKKSHPVCVPVCPSMGGKDDFAERHDLRRRAERRPADFDRIALLVAHVGRSLQTVGRRRPPTRPPVARPPPPPAHVTVFGKESGYSYTDDSQKRAIFSYPCSWSWEGSRYYSNSGEGSDISDQIPNIIMIELHKSKWKYCDRPKIENRNGASAKNFFLYTFTQNHFLNKCLCVRLSLSDDRLLLPLHEWLFVDDSSLSQTYTQQKSLVETEALKRIGNTYMLPGSSATLVQLSGPVANFFDVYRISLGKPLKFSFLTSQHYDAVGYRLPERPDRSDFENIILNAVTVVSLRYFAHDKLR
ncbi:unnamed protein product [Nesidiocoris tenuis]|uniref:Uncharacterized protein n=1 Tax=Nesidiocoris tenuis TaxID=355587 RepID=A0A6H5G4J3_9HEMI|nr:unnamed protein product [Nesidiocoris tenuis]